MKVPTKSSQAERWLAKRRGQLSLLWRLGPRTFAAYIRIARLAARERLWDLPPRPRHAAVPAAAEPAAAAEARP